MDRLNRGCTGRCCWLTYGRDSGACGVVIHHPEKANGTPEQHAIEGAAQEAGDDAELFAYNC